MYFCLSITEKSRKIQIFEIGVGASHFLSGSDASLGHHSQNITLVIQ